MSQPMSDVSLEQEPWVTPPEDDNADAIRGGIDGARYPAVIRHSLTSRVRTLLSHERVYSWEASELASTIHTFLGEATSPRPPELTAAERVEWKSLTQPDRRALLEVIFVYLGLRTDTGPRLLGIEGWEEVNCARDELVAGAVVEAAVALQMPPANRVRPPVSKIIVVLGSIAVMLTVVGSAVVNWRREAAVHALPYLNVAPADAGVLSNFQTVTPAPEALPTGLGPVDSVCSGDEIVCSSVKTAKPIDAVRALLVTIPNDAAKTYRVNVSVRYTDVE